MQSQFGRNADVVYKMQKSVVYGCTVNRGRMTSRL
jgi:hypothetical protein